MLDPMPTHHNTVGNGGKLLFNGDRAQLTYATLTACPYAWAETAR